MEVDESEDTIPLPLTLSSNEVPYGSLPAMDIVSQKKKKRFKLDGTSDFSSPISSPIIPPELGQGNGNGSTGDVRGNDNEFKFTSPNTDQFLKTGKFSTVDDIMEMISTPHMQKRETLAVATLCPKTKRAKLLVNKGNIKVQYGYDIGQDTYFQPEEALYLTEVGKLEILSNQVPLSIERARLIFLQNCNNQNTLTVCCLPDEYVVYKHFTKFGYRLRRRQPLNPSSISMDITSEDCEMKSNEIISDDIRELSSSRGLKRRAEGSSGPSDSSSPLHSVIDDEDSDCEFLESVEKESLEPDVVVTSCDEHGETDDQDQDMILGDQELSSLSPHAYYVAESDSDIEIVDEVLHCSVTIQEISSDADSYYEPGPSTSRGTRVIVDLVSSESSEEEIFWTSHFEPIWKKCLPGAKLILPFPPAQLLPSSILPRPGCCSTHFQLSRDNLKPELDIETIVDSLSIDDLQSKSGAHSSSITSWKEWRASVMAEVRDVIEDSLLGGVSDNTTSIQDRLHQWSTKSATKRCLPTSLHIPFELYPQSASRVHKNKLGTVIPPTHLVALVRAEEIVPNFGELGGGEEDEIPILVTVIGEDSNILHILCNDCTLPSLF